MVLYLCWFQGGFPAEKEGRQLEGCRRVELHASFEFAEEGQCVSLVGQRDFYSSLNPSSLLLRDEEDI